MDFIGNINNLARRMKCGGDMENSWIVFDHVKNLHEWITMTCKIYDNMHCKILTIACCDMPLEDA